jgi:hypothetical protein
MRPIVFREKVHKDRSILTPMKGVGAAMRVLGRFIQDNVARFQYDSVGKACIIFYRV